MHLGSTMLATTSHAAIGAVGLPSPSPGHMHELVVWCDNTDAAAARLHSAGAPDLVEPYAHIAGHRRSYITDLDGNQLAFVHE